MQKYFLFYIIPLIFRFLYKQNSTLKSTISIFIEKNKYILNKTIFLFLPRSVIIPNKNTPPVKIITSSLVIGWLCHDMLLCGTDWFGNYPLDTDHQIILILLIFHLNENQPNMMQTLDIIQFTDNNGNQRESACALLWIIIFSLVRLID